MEPFKTYTIHCNSSVYELLELKNNRLQPKTVPEKLLFFFYKTMESGNWQSKKDLNSLLERVQGGSAKDLLKILPFYLQIPC